MANEFKIKNGLIVDQGGAQITGSLNISGSILVNGSPITGSGGTTDTGSLLTTASYSSPNLTFTKGDGSTFDVVITVSGSGGTTNTGSLLMSASFSNPNLTFTKGNGTTFNVDLTTLKPTSASYASTASYAPSYVLNSNTSSFVQNSQTSSFVVNSQTSSFVLNSVTASMLQPYVLSSNTSSFVQNSQTSSFVLNSVTASMLQPYVLTSATSSMLQPYVLTASTASMTVLSSSYAKSASVSVSSSYTSTASYASSIGPLTQDVSVTGNLTVIGTASFTYSTASIVQVGASTITLNTNNPATRFGGISVIDSGSFGNSSTGSLFWDSQNNRWIYSNPSGSSYDGGMLISGPRNTSGLGNEAGMDANFVAVGQGADHIRPGSIYNSGSITIVTGSLTITQGVTGSFTGSLVGDLTGTASYSSQALSASYATTSSVATTSSYALTASYALNAGGGTGAGFPYSGSAVITGSLLVSGSGTTTIGNNTITGSILVNSPNITAGQFIGNQDGYVEFSLRNTSTGLSASGDFAIYADNGTPTNNYIDMGINNSGLSNAYFYGGTDFGNANDAYVYNVGGDLRIGNATSQAPYSQSLHLFSNPSATPNITITGSRVGIQKSSSLNATLDINGNAIVSGSLNVTQGMTGSLQGTSSWATNAVTASYVGGIYSYNFTASYSTATSWTVNHNLGTKNVIIQAYDSTDGQIVPKSITLNNANTATITFNTPETGYAIASVGGALNFATASVANIANSVGTLNQNVLITGSATIGSSSLGSTENTLNLGAPPAGGIGEGGQLGLLSPNSGSYTSASFLDNWQNTFRILRGSNNASNASVLNVDLQTGNINLPLGSITMPSRPAFRVSGSTVTGIAATTTITSTQGAVVDYNQGGYYNNSTGIFTAPIAGLYHVYLNLRTQTAGSQQAIIIKNSSNMVMWESNANTGHFGVSGILSLAVNDTLKVNVTVGTVQFDSNDNWGAAYIG